MVLAVIMAAAVLPARIRATQQTSLRYCRIGRTSGTSWQPRLPQAIVAHASTLSKANRKEQVCGDHEYIMAASMSELVMSQ